MHIIRTKLFAFYALSSTAVIVLFSAATTYGEANLKAPLKIDGLYRIDRAELPGCLNNRTLLLLLQQSGTYVSANLLSDRDREKTSVEEKPSLSGRWQNQQLVLEGPVTHISECKQQSLKLNITAEVTDKTLRGKIAFAEDAKDFTARLESSTTKPANH